MAVGFVHGVMNTDNMTISGETIDYGPCAFLDVFDPAAVFSSIDETGRYAYGNQPLAAEWDLARLAEALLPLVDDDQDRAVEHATEALGAFRPQYDAALLARRKASLGIIGVDDAVAAAARGRAAGPGAGRPGRPHGAAARPRPGRPRRRRARPWPASWTWPASTPGLARWLALAPDAAAMDRVNPAYVPRNHLVEQALTAGDGGRPRAARPAAGRRHRAVRRAPRPRAPTPPPTRRPLRT